MMRRVKIKGYFWCLILLIVSALISSTTVFANEPESQYIVYPKKSGFFSVKEQASDNFIVVDERELQDLLDAEMVEFYEEDVLGEFFVTPKVSYRKWDLEMIGFETSAEIGCFGQGVRVGIIDTGVSSHPELSECLTDGYNYVLGNNEVVDEVGHGTFVAGMVAAAINGEGIDSLAPRVEIIPLKCEKEKKPLLSAVANAIRGAVDDFDCDIINLSLGFDSDSITLQSAIDYALDNGVIIVSAVGNSGTDKLSYPAAYKGVIGVGSVDMNGNVSAFSQKNTSVMITAPGEDVISTYEMDTENGKAYYAIVSGTSMSSPLVAAACAVIKNTDENITRDEIIQVMTETATDSGENGYDMSYGHGILNIDAAIKRMLSEKEVFVSPVDFSEYESWAYVYNNAEEAFSGKAIMFSQENGIFKKCDVNSVYAEVDTAAKVIFEDMIHGDDCVVFSDKVAKESELSIKEVSLENTSDGLYKIRIEFSSKESLDDINCVISSEHISEIDSGETNAVISVFSANCANGNICEGYVEKEQFDLIMSDNPALFVSIACENVSGTASQKMIFNAPSDVKISSNVSFIADSNITSELQVFRNGKELDYSNGDVASFTRGDKIALKAPEKDGYVFRYWMRGTEKNGSWISSEPEYEFAASTNTYLTAVYTEKSEEKVVEFFNQNGEFYAERAVGKNGMVEELPSAPSLTGYIFDKWLLSEENEFNKNIVVTNDVTRAVARFKTNTDVKFTVKTPVGELQCNYGEKLAFNEPSAKYWMRDGEIVAYGSEYVCYVWDDTEIAYSEDDIIKQPIVMLDKDKKGDNYMIEFDAGDKTIIEAGILFGMTKDVTVNRCSSKATSANRTSHGQFTAKPKGEETYAKGYIVYLDNDSFKVVYSD